MIHVQFTLSANSLDPADTVEEAEKFCEYLKRQVLGVPGLAARHGIQATVDYSVSQVDAIPGAEPARKQA